MISFILRQPWLIAGITCFIAVFSASVYDIHRESPLKKKLHAYNIPTTIEELNAQYTTPPVNQNGAYLLKEAVRKLSGIDDTMKQTLPFTSDVPMEYGTELTPQQRETLQTYLSMNRESMALIFEAVKSPHIQYPQEILLAERYANNNAHLIYLILRAALEATLSDDNKTLGQTINAAYRLTLIDMPMNTEEYLYTLLCNEFLWFFEYILSITTPNRETLQAWRDMTADNTYRDYKRYQQISKDIVASYFLSSRYSRALSYGMKETDIHSVIPRMMFEWTDSLNTHEISFVQDALQTIDAGDQDIFNIINYHGDFDGDSSTLLFFLMFPHPAGGANYYPPYQRYAKLYTTANLAQAALSTRLYYYDHGHMPDTLDALIPEYLDAQLRDPFTPNQPIQYRIEEDTAIFYSAGQDGIYGKEVKKDCDCTDDIEFRLKIPRGNIPLVPPSMEELTHDETSSAGGQPS